MRTTLLLLSALTACSSVQLDGDWTGDATCGGATVPMTMTTASTEDADEAAGSGLVEFTASDGTEVSVAFDVDLSWDGVSGGNASIQADFSSCEEASLGPIACWSASDVSLYVPDEELTGSLQGFVVNDGNCEWSMEIAR